jgi:hypothetical protein
VTEDDLEAVQYSRAWGQWHAVYPDTDRTFCGLNAIKAKRMYQRWAEQPYRCATCEKGIARRLDSSKQT